MARVAAPGSIQAAFSAATSVIEAFFAEETLGIKGKTTKQQHSLRGGSAVNYSRLFEDFVRLVETDHKTFFTVLAHHPHLHLAVSKAAAAAEGSICSATKGSHRFTKRQLGALAVFVVRAVTDFSVTTGGGRGKNAEFDLDPVTYCGRLQQVFPAPVWMPLAHLISKVDGESSSVVFNALALSCPGTLSHLQATVMIWCDEVQAFSHRVNAEAKRGRFQRSNGDIVSLFERSFALIQGLWALLDSSPMTLVPFLPVARVLDALATHTNCVCPLLQHFLLNCTNLTQHRKQLSTVNSMIMNASVSASAIVLMFYPFKPAEAMRAAAGRDGLPFTKAVALRSYTLPSVVEIYEKEVVDSLLNFLSPLSVPVVLLQNAGRSAGSSGAHYSVLQVLDAVVPLLDKDSAPIPSKTSRRGKKSGVGNIGETVTDASVISSGGMGLGDLLLPLVQQAESAATGDAADGTQFIRSLLVELVNQGGSIDDWAARGLIDLGQARQLGADLSADPPASFNDPLTSPTHVNSEQDDIDAAIAASLADSDNHADGSAASAHPKSGALFGSTPQEREHVAMILDIAPVLKSESHALAALRFYNGDMEALLVDATSDNLPPHLLTVAAEVPSLAAASSGPPAVASAQSASSRSKKEGYLNIHTFLFSNWNAYQNDGDEDDGGEIDEDDIEEEGGWEAMATTNGGGRSESDQLFSSPNDTEMHAITRMLVDQILYEDERDDGQDYEAEAIIPTRNPNHRNNIASRPNIKYGQDDEDDEPGGDNAQQIPGGVYHPAHTGAVGHQPPPRYTMKSKYDSSTKRKTVATDKKDTKKAATEKHDAKDFKKKDAQGGGDKKKSRDRAKGGKSTF